MLHEVLHRPRHPYSSALLASVPSLEPEDRGHLTVLPGDVPSAINPPSGCRFHPRCPERMLICETENPEMREVAEGARRACHLPDETVLRQDSREMAEPRRPSHPKHTIYVGRSARRIQSNGIEA